MDSVRIAVYVRVSKEEYCITNNEKNGEKNAKIYKSIDNNVFSNSILNQRKIIEQYISEHFIDYTCFYYEDDGYTGMNYSRPGFIKLIQDAFTGKIDVIIVKDLSRFGREYIETGKYIKRILPSLKIRFISINDDYDSNSASISQTHLIMPIKSFINECYSRDISRKVRTNLEVMRKNGQYVGAYVAYGYKKSTKDINKIEVDRVIAPYVRYIYKKYLQGYSIGQIQKLLDNKGVMTPYRYKKMINNNYYSGFVQEGDKWSYSSINRILKNEIYIGNMIQGKRTTVNYKIKKCVDKKSRDWIRVVNNHEAIISKEEFYGVQRRLGIDCRISNKTKYRYPLSGLLWCGKCGNLMVRRSGKLEDTYICSEYNKSGQCVRNAIKERIAMDIVKSVINLIIGNISVINDKNVECFKDELLKNELIENREYKIKDKEEKENKELINNICIYYCNVYIDRICIFTGKRVVMNISLVKF